MDFFTLLAPNTTTTTTTTTITITADKSPRSLLQHNKRSLIVRLSLLTLVASAMLLSSGLLIERSYCNPLNSQLPQQTVNKAFKATSSVLGARTSVQRQKRNQRASRQQPFMAQAEKMKFELNNSTSDPAKSKQKRTASVETSSSSLSAQNGAGQANQHQAAVKRFKTSSNLDTLHSSSSFSTNQSARSTLSAESTMEAANGNRMSQNVTSTDGDINNNINNEQNLSSLDASDVNNNTIQTTTTDEQANNQQQQQQEWQRNINSVNGTIDLSQYGQTGLDRLYGDALLVYLKNFNETLPGRREIISVNGTTSQVPIYRSERRSTANPGWNNPL